MTEKASNQDPAAADAGGVPPAGKAPRARPDHVPEKFWDDKAGQLRTEALLKSYLELERRQGAGTLEPPVSDAARSQLFELLGRPSSPDGYKIEPPHGLIEPDPDLNRRLHEAGLTQDQAQLVYELAAERLLPALGQMIGEVEARHHTDQLERHFGGPEAWRETARQLKTWADASLEPAVHDALASSHDGVLAMHQMMRASEPKLLDADGEGSVSLTEDALYGMMRDPRYWRDRNPEFVTRVTDGFRRLFPS